MANALAGETSPYLLQHAENPVDWVPWGPEALAEAKRRDVPLLVSIGYSACHWCHVMAHESFEDDETAAYLNEHFVAVKIDREELPDVDATYMEFVQASTGHGGWPLTAFCDPSGAPFYGGTYFPPDQRHGLPSFRMVMQAVVETWRNRRDDVAKQTSKAAERLGATSRLQASAEPIGQDLVSGAVAHLRAQADMNHGGFGGAPKFPPALALELLMAHGAGDVVERTLDAMAAGGIFDQLAGGFARYSVDGRWLIPHFEKMLYDNALLAGAYLDGYRTLGHPRYERICRRTLDWMLDEMRGPEGGFYSALDADSEGVEGKFYAWDAGELRTVIEESGLEEFATEALVHLGVSHQGNFEGANVLNLPGGLTDEEPDWLAPLREALLARRSGRVRPGLDDKRLCSWNALAIGALARSGAVLGDQDYVGAAIRAAEFVLGEMRDGDGRLLRSWKDGQGKVLAYLDDHAFLVEALLDLYEATFDVRWFEAAEQTAETMSERFADDGNGFFTTSAEHDVLISRRKDADDHPIPSGNSSAALGLLRLSAITGEPAYEKQAVGVLRMLRDIAERHPQGTPHLLRAIDFYTSPTREVALISPAGAPRDALDELAATVRAQLRPNLVLAGGTEGSAVPPLLADRPALDGGPTAYVCERFSCQAPVTGTEELAAQLG